MIAGAIAILGWLAAALAVVGCVYVAAAAWLTRRFLGRAAAASGPAPPVSLLKPLHGAYPGMDSVLEGFCDQTYAGPVQVLFGVDDEADPAATIVEALKTRRPDADIHLVVDGAQHGANRKVSNVINIARHARHEVLVLSDADIAVGPDYLRDVTTALAGEGVGAATCLYVGAEAGGGPWSRLAAMAITYGFLPNAVLGRTLGMADPCFGSTIALTRATMAGIGGFEAFADQLADDYEIGRAVRARGRTIAIPPIVVSHLCVEPGFAALTSHELRWGRTVRQIDPAGYAGSVITYPLPLALIATALLGVSVATLCLIFVAFGVRIAGKTAIDAATGARTGRWWLIPLRDVLSFAMFVTSFAVDTVGWQGRRFRVGRGGVLSHP